MKTFDELNNDIKNIKNSSQAQHTKIKLVLNEINIKLKQLEETVKNVSELLEPKKPVSVVKDIKPKEVTDAKK